MMTMRSTIQVISGAILLTLAGGACSSTEPGPADSGSAQSDGASSADSSVPSDGSVPREAEASACRSEGMPCDQGRCCAGLACSATLDRDFCSP